MQNRREEQGEGEGSEGEDKVNLQRAEAFSSQISNFIFCDALKFNFVIGENPDFHCLHVLPPYSDLLEARRLRIRLIVDLHCR